jgi:hypothetical protein
MIPETPNSQKFFFYNLHSVGAESTVATTENYHFLKMRTNSHSVDREV